MRLVRLGMVVTALVALGSIPARTQDFESELQRATQREVTTGDLRAVANEYLNLATRAESSNRAVAASALLRAADVYRKLGDGQAHAIYERVVAAFADQAEAVTAARQALGQRSSLSMRQIWTLPVGSAHARAVSPDERHLAFIDQDLALAVRNLRTHVTERLTTAPAADQRPREREVPSSPAFSRDGQQIAFGWSRPGEGGERTMELRSAAFGTSGRSVRTLYRNPDIRFILPYDWTPNGQRVAVLATRADGTSQIGFVSTGDGSLTVLKSMEWRLPGQMAFSPDGLHLAVDLPASDTTSDRDVYVFAADGSREMAIAGRPGRDVVVGWSPDGRYLVIESDRGGVSGLWGVPMSGGRQAGQPRLLKANFDVASPIGITSAGRLFYRTRTLGRLKVKIATADFTKMTVSTPRDVDDSRAYSTRTPDFSHDGSVVAYVAEDVAFAGERLDGTHRITIRDLGTGQVVRQLRPEPQLGYIVALRWAPDGQSLAVASRDLRGRYGVFIVNAMTGATRGVALSAPGPATVDAPAWSADGRTLFYLRSEAVGTQERAVIAHDLASGAEREIYRRDRLVQLQASPDGRYLATIGGARPPQGGSSTVVIIATSDGTARELTSSRPGRLDLLSWLPDSRALLHVARTERPVAIGTTNLWLLSLDGSDPKPVTGFTDGEIRVHPDGHRIAVEEHAFVGAPPPDELWVLENFLPSPARR